MYGEFRQTTECKATHSTEDDSIFVRSKDIEEQNTNVICLVQNPTTNANHVFSLLNINYIITGIFFSLLEMWRKCGTIQMDTDILHFSDRSEIWFLYSIYQQVIILEM